MFGSSNPYSQAGETQINVSTRNLRSTDHYNGTVYQAQRKALDTYVVNLQHMVDVSVTHNFSERLSMGVGVPFISSSWGIPMPIAAGRGARVDQVGRGLGDISVSSRAWVLPTDRFTSGNFAVGIGVKMPTGKSDVQATYPSIAGTNPQLKPVDQSVQPGDGGWGLTMDISGFKRIPHATLFGSASYLANPRDRNNTTAIGYNISAAPAIAADGTSYNSVPDQYMARLGAAVPIASTGFACSLTWRVEGLPRYDLIGESHGFRRPGVEMFIEPGVSYAKGGHVYSVQVPIGYYRNRFPNPYTDRAGDATFPKYIFLASYGYRFGGATKANASIASVGAAPRGTAAGDTLKPFKLKTLEGAPKTLSDVLGSKATLVVFFYPTCPYCNVAAPDIQRLYDTYKAQGFSVVWVNVQPDEDKLVAGWQADHGYTAPVLVGASVAAVQRDYDVSSTPTHYLLDASGKILSKHGGYQRGDEVQLEQEIKQALGGAQ